MNTSTNIHSFFIHMKTVSWLPTGQFENCLISLVDSVVCISVESLNWLLNMDSIHTIFKCRVFIENFNIFMTLWQMQYFELHSSCQLWNNITL